MTDAVYDLQKQLMAFRAGKVWIGEGSYGTATAAKAIFTDLAVKATELSTNFVLFSDLAEDPGNFVSTVEMLKSMNYSTEGKRSNVLTLNVVGLSDSRKAYLESTLGEGVKTILLESQNGKDLLIFSGRKWGADHTTGFAGLNTGVIKTEWFGPTEDKYIPISGLVAGT